MTSVLFVHAQWLHASSCEPWMEMIVAERYEPVAAGWPGEHSTVADVPDALAWMAEKDPRR